MALFFRNWIGLRSGVNKQNKASDLHFMDGKLDMIRMYDIISKNNILSELLTMRQTLLAYQEHFMSINCVHYVQSIKT